MYSSFAPPPRSSSRQFSVLGGGDCGTRNISFNYPGTGRKGGTVSPGELTRFTWKHRIWRSRQQISLQGGIAPCEALLNSGLSSENGELWYIILVLEIKKGWTRSTGRAVHCTVQFQPFPPGCRCFIASRTENRKLSRTSPAGFPP